MSTFQQITYSLPPKTVKMRNLHVFFVISIAEVTGFIRSGKIRGKHIFFEMVRESQGIQRKSQGKVGKSQGDFFEKFLSPMNQDPLFFKIQSIFFKINYDRTSSVARGGGGYSPPPH